MRVLLLCNYDPSNAATVTEHINAIVKYSEHDVFVYTDLLDNNGDLKIGVKKGSNHCNIVSGKVINDRSDRPCLEDFDAVIIHYSIFIAIEQYLSIKSRYKLAKFPGVKVVFLQDEYRFVDRSIKAMHELGIDVVFTCVPEHSIEAVYPKERMAGIRVLNTLTGYPSDFLSVLEPKPLRKRRYHVCYRGRRYPDWHGRMGREKVEIGENFRLHARKYGLRINISSREKDRLYGVDWVNLIQNSRAVLGVESGASVFDFSGDISARTETVRALLGKKGIGHDALRQKYFADAEDKIDLAQISPRIFEAICLRTLCVLYEGNYSGILVPDVHYLSLKKDFSNIEHVCKRLGDDAFVSEIISNAYTEIANGQTHTYRNFIHKLDHEIKTSHERKHGGKSYIEKNIPLDLNFDTEEFRESYQKIHPFHMISFPHVFKVKYDRGFKFLKKIAEFLPSGIRSSLKSFVQRR